MQNNFTPFGVKPLNTVQNLNWEEEAQRNNSPILPNSIRGLIFILTTEGKICSKCKEFKYLHDYYKNKTKSMGIESACKKCNNILKRNHYHNNKEKYKEAFQEFMIRNPDYYKK